MQNQQDELERRWPSFTVDNVQAWIDDYYAQWGDLPAAVLVLDSEASHIYNSHTRCNRVFPTADFTDMKWVFSTPIGAVLLLLHREKFPEQYSPNSYVGALERERRLLPGKSETEVLVQQTILEE